MKKYLGSLMACLCAVFVGFGSASMFFVGTEEMPESMKNNR